MLTYFPTNLDIFHHASCNRSDSCTRMTPGCCYTQTSSRYNRECFLRIRSDLQVKQHFQRSVKFTVFFKTLHLNQALQVFIYLGFNIAFNTCTGHTMMGSFVGRGNQYIQSVKVLYCKRPTIGKQLPTFRHKIWGLNRRPQRWEASVLPLRHRGLLPDIEQICKITTSY